MYIFRVPTAMPANTAAICTVLSAPRAQTYISATGGDLTRAMALYSWNARIAAALMVPFHFAEIATRNAVSDALTATYGPRWPWDSTFEHSLPGPGGGAYNPRRDLTRARSGQRTTGKVVAELKFAFWQSMFTARHDVRIWDNHIHALFPSTSVHTVGQLRGRIYTDLDSIRKLRNRVAHHEPIFSRNLAGDLTRLLDLVELRCADTAAWLRAMEEVSAILPQRP
ncbi:hypothetical protein [Nocardia asteroides]|uniref:hypothetical protein n=1 Tax=Nocardia asteroides TaxID=1824 RepID=UPI0036506F86